MDFSKSVLTRVEQPLWKTIRLSGTKRTFDAQMEWDEKIAYNSY